MFKYICTVLFVIINTQNNYCVTCNNGFPKDFLFGVSTSSYQIEGAWDEDGKGQSIWDLKTHNYSETIANHSNGDIACDSYHKTEEDIKLLVELGVNVYRFSISWPRVLPTGFSNLVNEKGIQYYNNLLDALIAHNITPMVTLFHWDLPLTLGELGGWTNPLIVDYFVEYAELAFERFADRVKYWITINEPKQICLPEYGVNNLSGIGDYLCGHHIIKAHARTYHLYKEKYYEKYKGKVSFSPNIRWKQPLTNDQKDLDAAERMMQFILGWYGQPIYSKTGNYPPIMQELVSYNSYIQGFKKSRLPKFTKEEVEYIRGTFDFVGINYYTTWLITSAKNETINKIPHFFKDTRSIYLFNNTWETSNADWLKVVPWGLRKVLNWTKHAYDDPEIFILENGYADAGDIQDYKRISYLKRHLNEVLKAIHIDGVRVIGYIHWSLLDNFEWWSGYQQKYGLYYVDFNHENRTRIIKNSARVYKKIIAEKKIDWTYLGNE